MSVWYYEITYKYGVYGIGSRFCVSEVIPECALTTDQSF